MLHFIACSRCVVCTVQRKLIEYKTGTRIPRARVSKLAQNTQILRDKLYAWMHG